MGWNYVLEYTGKQKAKLARKFGISRKGCVPVPVWSLISINHERRMSASLLNPSVIESQLPGIVGQLL